MVLDLARSYPIQDLTRSMLMLALKAARLNWSLQSTLSLCFIACTALLCSLQYFYKWTVREREGPPFQTPCGCGDVFGQFAAVVSVGILTHL